MRHQVQTGRRHAPRKVGVLVLWALLLCVSVARATLTDSEKCQVRSYVQEGKLATVPRLRALIARPDLSEQEISDVLSSPLRTRRFDDAVRSYLEALLFGPTSRASRSVIMPSVVRALLSRADAVVVQQPGDPTQRDTRASDELLRIHQFVEEMLARARGAETKGVAGLQSDACRRIAQGYADHVARHRAWYSFDQQVRGTTLLLRAQIALVLRMASEGLIDRSRTAETLALGPAARGLFLRTGILFDDGGMGPEVRRREVIGLLDSIPGSLEKVELVLVSKVSRRNWSSRQQVLFVRTPLGPVAPRREDLWPSPVRAADPEHALFETAWAATSSVIRRRLGSDAAYTERLHQALAAAADKGSFGVLAPWLVHRSLDRNAWQLQDALSPVDFAAAPATLLLLDVERTVDLALMRWLAGRPESFEQVLLGLEALAPNAAGDGDEAKTLSLGKITTDGLVAAPVELIAKHDRCTGLVFGGHRYEATIGSNGRVTEVLRDGQPFEIGDLATIDVPTSAGNQWKEKYAR